MSTITKDVSIKEDGTYITKSDGKSAPYKIKCTVSLTRNHGESFSTLIVENIQGMSGWGDVSDWRIVVTANGVSDTVYHIGYNSISYNKDGKHKQYKWYDFPSDITLTVPVGSNAGILNVSIKFEVGQGWKTNQDKSPNISLVGNEYIVQMQYDSMGASTISSVTNITVGENPTIKFLPYSTSFYYKLKFEINSWSYTTAPFNCSSISNEYSYSSYAIPLEVLNQITTSTKGTIIVSLYTYENSSCTNQIGDVSTKTFSALVPDNIIPTVSNLVLTLVNDNQIINSWGVAISGFTKLKFTCNASGVYGSTITSFRIKNLYSSEQSVNGTSLNYTSGVIQSSGNKTYQVYAIDSRGRSSQVLNTNQIYIYSYASPSITNFFADRYDDDKTKVVSTVYCSYSNINNKNTITCTLYYQNMGNIAWQKCDELQNNTPKVVYIQGGFKKDSAYRVKVIVKDSIGNSSEQILYIGTLDCFMDWRQGGKGLGLGIMAEDDGFWCKFPAHFWELNMRIQSESGDITDYTLKEYIQAVVNGNI